RSSNRGWCNLGVTYPPCSRHAARRGESQGGRKTVAPAKAGAAVGLAPPFQRPPPSRGRRFLILARAHRAQAVAQGPPGGDAFGDLAVDDEGRGAGDLVLFDPRVGALFDRLDIFGLAEALLDRRGGDAALLVELVDAPALGERGEPLRRRQLHRCFDPRLRLRRAGDEGLM